MEFKVGDVKNFTFRDNPYVIKEIIEPTDFEMDYVWDTGICPHCKEKIIRTVHHKFSKIEILADNTIKGNLKRENLVILGYSVDNRLLRIDETHYDEILSKSKLFKDLREV